MVHIRCFQCHGTVLCCLEREGGGTHAPCASSLSSITASASSQYECGSTCLSSSQAAHTTPSQLGFVIPRWWPQIMSTLHPICQCCLLCCQEIMDSLVCCLLTAPLNGLCVKFSFFWWMVDVQRSWTLSPPPPPFRLWKIYPVGILY